VRITLSHFVTYTFAQFFPGPHLNMVVGPNGTGKSTVVCAICLGLGWKPEHLGRAKDISEFVKHGFKDGSIEIELKADPRRHQTNPVITCKINRDGGRNAEKKTSWKLNGQNSTHKAVQELVKSFSIQVDNLCQFLPQDRVAEFAALSPVDLLVHTQRAAAPPYMSEWHDKLKKLRKDEKVMLHNQQDGLDNLKKMEDRQRSQAGEVERMRERTAIQDKLVMLEEFRPFTEFNELRRKHMEAKARRKAVDKELKLLERRNAPNLKAVEEKGRYVEHLKGAAKSKSTLLNKARTHVANKAQLCQETDKKVKDVDANIKAEQQATGKAKQDIGKHSATIRDIQSAMEHPPAAFDPSEMNEKMRTLKQQIDTLQQEDTQQSLHNLNEQARQRIQLVEAEKEKRAHLQTQAGRQASQLQGVSRESHALWVWIESNRDKFQGDVYAPPMMSCSVKNKRHADWVEAVIGPGELKAFTVSSPQDFKMLTNQAYNVLRLHDVSVRSSTQALSNFKPPVTDDQRQRLGLDGWILDLIEGPDPVLAMLCDNRNLHMTGHAERDITQEQFEALEQNSSIGAWATPKSIYQVTRRREYGAAGVTTRVSQFAKAKILTDAPVNTQAEQGIDSRIRELEGEIADIKHEIAGVKERDSVLQRDIKRLQEEREAIKTDKDMKQQNKTEFDGLPTKLQTVQSRLDACQAQADSQFEKLMTMKEEEFNLMLEKGQQALDHANAIRLLWKLYEEFIEVEVMRIEAESDLHQLKARNEEEAQLLDNKKAEVKQLKDAEDELKAEGLEVQTRCAQLGAAWGVLTPEKEAIQHEVAEWEPHQLDTEIASIQATLEMLAGAGNAHLHLIKEFEERAEKIERKRAQLRTMENDIAKLTSEIADLASQWEPRLDELVRQISEAFADNFSRIQCAGEVEVYKDEDDFDQWAIQIKVKFRYVGVDTGKCGEILTVVGAGRTNSSAFSTRIGSLVVSVLCRLSSTLWHCKASPRRPSGWSTRSTRAWIRAMKGESMSSGSGEGRARKLTDSQAGPLSHGGHCVCGAHESILPHHAQASQQLEVSPQYEGPLYRFWRVYAGQG
jgi:chromosome segregation ATPase